LSIIGARKAGRAGPTGIPGSRSDLARSLYLAGALARTVRTLRAAGIPSLTFKGPALGALLHGDPALRPCDDIDLLVRPADFPRAVRAAASLGFEPGVPLARNGDAPRGLTQVPLVRADGVVLDLHARLAPDYDTFSLDREDLFGEADRVDIGGEAVPVLCADHHFLYLAFHGGKSLWARRSRVEDMALFLERGPPIRRERVLALAARTGSLRMLAVAVLLGESLRGGRPGGAREAAAWTRPDAEALRLAIHFGQALLRGVPAATTAAAGVDLQLRLRERARDRAAFLLALCFTPTPGERAADGRGILRPLAGGLRTARAALLHAPRLAGVGA